MSDVNKQLLNALKMVLDDPDALDGRPRTYECVVEAIAAAEQAQQITDSTRVAWTSLGTVKAMLPELLASDDVKVRENAQIIDALVKLVGNQQAQAVPVAWQFYENGRWWSGDDRTKDHRKHTEDAGIPTRDLYAQPPAQPVARDVLMAAMNDVRRAQLKIVREGLQGGRWIEDIDDAVSGIDLDSIADRHATALTVEMHSTDLNDRKAAEIIQAQDFTATGYVLTGQDGRYALCNGGAVRWLDKAEYQHTMFPGVEHAPVPVAYLKTAAGVMQLSFEGNPVVNVGADVEVQADTVQPLYAR